MVVTATRPDGRVDRRQEGSPPQRPIALVMAPRALQAEALAALLEARSSVDAVACNTSAMSPSDGPRPEPDLGVVWGWDDMSPVLELVRRAAALWAGVPLVVVADHLTAEHVHVLSGCGVAAMLDGAACASAVVYAIGQVLRGHHLYAVKCEPSPKHDVGRLSGRQLEVLRLLADGRSNREIAAQLYISVNTVKYHVHSILTQLRLRNRTEAARVFVEPTRKDGPTTARAGVGADLGAP